METKMTQAEQKHFSKDSWPDIFKRAKIILRGNAFDEVSTVLIDHANSNFTEMFGHSLSTQLRLNDLIGPATSLAKFDEIKRSMDKGESSCAYINLYRSDGTALSCHVSLLSITGSNTYAEPYVVCSAQNGTSTIPDSKISPTLPSQSDFVGKSAETNRAGERYAILTIRSAAVVGNARDFGIGFFGLSFITEDAKLQHVAKMFGVTHLQPTADSSKSIHQGIAGESTDGGRSGSFKSSPRSAFHAVKKGYIPQVHETPASRLLKSLKPKLESGSGSGSDDSEYCDEKSSWKVRRTDRGKKSTGRNRRPTGRPVGRPAGRPVGRPAGRKQRLHSTSTTTSIAAEECNHNDHDHEMRYPEGTYEEMEPELCQGNFIPMLNYADECTSPTSSDTKGFLRHILRESGVSSATTHEFSTPSTSGGDTTASSSSDDSRPARLMKPTFLRSGNMPGPLNAEIFQTKENSYPVHPLSPSLLALARNEEFVPDESGSYSVF